MGGVADYFEDDNCKGGRTNTMDWDSWLELETGWQGFGFSAYTVIKMMAHQYLLASEYLEKTKRDVFGKGRVQKKNKKKK